MAKDTVEEQTQKAFAPKSAADLYREQQITTGRQKGTGVGDLIVEGVSDTVSAIREDPKGAAMGVVTGLKDEFNEFRSDPKEYVIDAVEGAVTGTVNFLTKNEEDRLLEKFGKTFKEATDDQVTEIRKDTLSDAMIAAGVIPGVGQAGKVTGKALYKATGPGGAFEYNPNQLNMFVGPNAKNPPTENLKEAFEADGFNFTGTDIQDVLEAVDFDLSRQKKDPTYQLGVTNTLKALGDNGWFKGTDKKWKFEVSDKSATFGDNREIELKQNILNRLAMPKSEINNLNFSDPDIILPSSSAAVPLGYLLRHNTLYSQYPDLAGYPIVVDSDLAGKATQGYQNSRGFIAVSPDVLDNPEKLKSLLLHEIMHSIQDEEGFGQGTSTKNSDVRKFYDFQTNLPEAKAEWADYYKTINVHEKDVTSKTKNLNKNLKDFIEKNGTSGTIDDLQEIMEDAERLDFFIEASKVLGSDSVLLEGRDLTKYTQRSSDLLNKIIGIEFVNKDGFFDISGKEKLYKRFMEKIGVDPFETNFPDLDYFEVIGVPEFNKPLPKYLDPDGNFDYSQRYDIYRRKMGEVESRLVSDRMNLDESEIKTEPLNPDVPPDEQWSDATLSQDMYLQTAKNQKNKRRTTGIKFLPEDKNNTQGFAQGGLADMNTQTQRAFALGGEAETVDPVSGNDVPPGSLPEEVRDDIDAKLSEGEYVVPADVVRYYGVKFFENLRTKAKQGLQQMDEDGRIGGEPTSEMSLPFDISELEVEDDDGMRMAVGGLVAEYAVGGYTGVGSSFGGYGGYTGYKPYDPTVQPVTVTAPPPVTAPAAAPANTGSQLKTYYDKMGNQVSVMFVNGQPQRSLQGLTTSNPNASGNSGPVDVNKNNPLVNAPVSSGTSARQEVDKDNLLNMEKDDFNNYISTQMGKGEGVMQRIIPGLVGAAVSTINPLAGLAVGQGMVSRNNLKGLENSEVALKVMESRFGSSENTDVAAARALQKQRIEEQRKGGLADELLSKLYNNADARAKAILESPTTVIEEGDNTTVVNKPEPTPVQQPQYTRSRAEELLGIETPSLRRDARDDQGNTINTAAKDLNWEEVRQLRSYDSAANRNKLAEWEKASDAGESKTSSGGCFLTTAIVEHRGEADNGPTLTKLRHFRDTYLSQYPEEIKKYYEVAPKIVAAIPKNNPTWNWVGTQIDSAVQHIDNNMLAKAHKVYKNMVLELETNWLEKV